LTVARLEHRNNGRLSNTFSFNAGKCFMHIWIKWFIRGPKSLKTEFGQSCVKIVAYCFECSNELVMFASPINVIEDR